MWTCSCSRRWEVGRESSVWCIQSEERKTNELERIGRKVWTDGRKNKNTNTVNKNPMSNQPLSSWKTIKKYFANEIWQNNEEWTADSGATINFCLFGSMGWNITIQNHFANLKISITFNVLYYRLQNKCITVYLFLYNIIFITYIYMVVFIISKLMKSPNKNWESGG